MGKIDKDKIFTISIINSLGRHYSYLQSVIHGMTDNPNFTPSLALKRLENEAALEERRAELGFQPSAVALIASDKDTNPPTGTPPTSPNTGSPSQTVVPLAMSGATTEPVASYSPSSITLNGISYLLIPTSSNDITTSHSADLCDHTGPPLDVSELVNFSRFPAAHDKSQTSLDWDRFSNPVELVNFQAQVTMTPTSQSPAQTPRRAPLPARHGGDLSHFPGTF